MSDVFISYSVDDEKKAKEVHKLLTSYGISTFLAGISLEPGDDWSDEILGNLNTSKWVLFFASKAACKSPAVQQELGIALGTGKQIIPVTWDIKPEQLPAWIKGKQAIDLTKGRIENLRPTAEKIAKQLKSDKVTTGIIIALLGVAFFYASKGK